MGGNASASGSRGGGRETRPLATARRSRERLPGRRSRTGDGRASGSRGDGASPVLSRRRDGLESDSRGDGDPRSRANGSSLARRERCVRRRRRASSLWIFLSSPAWTTTSPVIMAGKPILSIGLPVGRTNWKSSVVLPAIQSPILILQNSSIMVVSSAAMVLSRASARCVAKNRVEAVHEHTTRSCAVRLSVRSPRPAKPPPVLTHGKTPLTAPPSAPPDHRKAPRSSSRRRRRGGRPARWRRPERSCPIS